jgi:very-short-patch-repair endonuclease
MAIQTARKLRQSLTPQEVKLWVHLRSWRSRGFHFRRQAPRDNAILDFVCLKHRLIIEVDGGQHNEGGQAERDMKRDRHFERQEFRVLRFWNSDVDRNLGGVLTAIDNALRAPHPPASGGHPPPAGEG